MIEGYEGNVGSGKTYHAVQRIVAALEAGRNVITDIWVDFAQCKPKQQRKLRGRYVYMPEITIPTLALFDRKYHDHTAGVFNEHQTLVVIDEVYNYFDPRDFDRPDRALWVSFLKVSRHYCFDFLVIGQDLRTDLDKKIYRCLEFTTIHKAVARLQWGFQLLVLFTGKWFLCVRWSCSKGAPKIKIDVKWLHLKKRVAMLYNSHQTFDNSAFARQLVKYLDSSSGLEDLPVDLQEAAIDLRRDLERQSVERERQRRAQLMLRLAAALQQVADRRGEGG